MKLVKFAFLLALSLVTFFFASCRTAPETIDQSPSTEPVVQGEPIAPLQLEEPAKEEPAEEAPIDTSPVVEEPEGEATVIQMVVEEDVEPPVVTLPEEPPEEVFTVTEEMFTETFENIRKIIDELNSIIQEENYDRWLRYLAEEYIDHFSSVQILTDNSEQPLLKKYGITLGSLRDYFKYVVVPSRSNARLDDLVFIDNDHVKAIMIISDRRTILYQLTRVDRVWKIGL